MRETEYTPERVQAYHKFYDTAQRLAKRSMYGIIRLSACYTSGDYLKRVVVDEETGNVILVSSVSLVDGRAVPVGMEHCPGFVYVPGTVEHNAYIYADCPDRDAHVEIWGGTWIVREGRGLLDHGTFSNR